MNDSLKVGNGHVGTTIFLDQVEEVGVAHLRPGSRDQRIAGKQ
jgi:hypothetical protein